MNLKTITIPIVALTAAKHLGSLPLKIAYYALKAATCIVGVVARR